MGAPPAPGIGPGDRYEVLVAGGGPAGSVAALVLAQAGRRVLLADRSGRPDPAGGVPLAETLPAAAGRLLGDLGLSASLRDGPHLPSYGTLSAWGSPLLVATDSLYDPDGAGWRLDRGWFDRSLRDAAARAGAEVVTATVRPPVRAGDGWWAGLLPGEGTPGRAEPREIRFGRLVDATGRGAALARRLGGIRRADDRLVCTAALFRPSGPAGSDGAAASDQDTRTLVEAVPDGWWYTALLPGGVRSVGFVSDADLTPRRLRTAGGYLGHLAGTAHLHALLARHRYRLAAPPHRVAAHGGRLDPPGGDGWLAAGDAALSVDPLAAQGLLTALHTGALAGQVVLASLTAADPDPLDRYRARLDTMTDAYRRNHREFYTQERRWPDAPFWRRRVQPSSWRGWQADTEPATTTPRVPPG